MSYTKWSTIKVPVSIKEIIDKLAQAEQVPRHVIVSKAIQSYINEQRKVGGTMYLKGKRHPRGLWYGWKLLLSYAEWRIAIRYRRCFPHTVLEKLLQQFGDTLYQLRERMKVVTPDEMKTISKLAREYMANQNNQTLYHLNDVIRDIFYRVITR